MQTSTSLSQPPSSSRRCCPRLTRCPRRPSRTCRRLYTTVAASASPAAAPLSSPRAPPRRAAVLSCPAAARSRLFPASLFPHPYFFSRSDSLYWYQYHW
ncbi:unnamed protein product [Linum trigynum]|uniref:Uncharacterized protein n=1 Tax=Linum trigynum TaxID=586398 RepID=A0AAV2D428_9ROSI